MALNFQPLSIVFSGGIDTKADPKTVQTNRLLELQNGVFTRPGIIAKRFGNDVLPRAIVGSTNSITAAQAIAVFNDELLLFSGTRVYSWSPALASYLDRGAVSACAATETQIIRNSAAQANPDVAVNAGVRLVAWEDSRGGVRYSVQDVVTGGFFVADVLAKSTASQPQCVAFGSELVLFYTVGANLYYRRINVTTPALVGAETSPIATMKTPANRYDVLVVGARLFIGWNDAVGDLGSPKACIAYLDASYTLSPYGFATAEGSTGIALAVYSASLNVSIVFADTTTVRAKAFTYALTVASGTSTIEVVTPVAHVAAVASATSLLSVFYEVDGHVRSNTVNYLTGVVGTPSTLMRGVTLWSKAATYNGVTYLALARTSPYQSVYFIVDGATGQVVAKVAPEVGGGARVIAGLTPLPNTSLATLAQVSPGVFEMGFVELGRLLTESGQAYALGGAKVARLDFTARARWATAKLRNNILIGGGVVQMYDGYALGEAGFHQWPEGVTISAGVLPTFTVTTPGAVGVKEVFTVHFSSTTYIAAQQYFVCWDGNDTTEILVYYSVDGVSAGLPPGATADVSFEVAILSTDDANAIVTKTAAAAVASGYFTSATVSGFTVTFTAKNTGVTSDPANGPPPYGVGTGPPDGTYSYTAIYERTDNFGQVHRSAPATPVQVSGTTVAQRITIPTLRTTSWANTRIAVYRTKSNQTTFHRITPIAHPLANDTTADFANATDGGNSDTDIAGNEVLYTTGGVLEADAPAGSSLLATFKDRVFLAGQADPYALKYSTITAVGEAVYFSDALSITVDQRGGPITALATMDDKLIIFKESAIFLLTGDGPTNTGANDDFGPPALVTTDTGCSNPSSIVPAPQGLMFQTPKGFYLLDRGGNCSYLGEQIEQFNDAQVTGAQLAPSTNQIRFVSSNAPALVFDYLAGEWATFTGFESVGCAVWRGSFVFAKSDGRVFVENPAKFTDGDRPYFLVITTSNIAPGGLQGWLRVKELRVLGTYKGPHTLRVSIATDYNDSYTQIEPFDAASLYASSAYGAVSPYGADPVYGGTWKTYQFGVRVTRAKCQAIRVRIEDTQASGYNEGMAINGLALLVGMKPGVARLPASRRA